MTTMSSTSAAAASVSVVLVMFETEGYENRTTCVVKGFFSSEKAEAYVAHMNSELREENAHMDDVCELTFDRCEELRGKFPCMRCSGGMFFVGKTILIE